MRGGAFLKGKEGRVGFRKDTPISLWVKEEFIRIFKRATKLHHRKVAQKMGEGAVRP